MSQAKSVYELSKEEKKAIIKNGEPVFDNQEDKIKSINELIEFIDNMIAKHSKGDDLNSLLILRLIRYFILEHRDVLEQYELDYDDE
jgi:hypothetical protein